MTHHHNHHHRPLPPSVNMGGDGDGPTSDSGATEVVGSKSMTNIYYDDGPLPLLGGSVIVRTLQPFDISTTTTSTTAFKSPGRMAATLGFPFTSAQWKELERQAMIYKYMMASVTVPPDLLLPITQNLSADPFTPRGSGSIFNLRCSNNKDPEPGRCKRTDGKKWRCARDVAPHQKYCERHLHRGRPRSRKPVEVHASFSNSSKKTRVATAPTDLPNPTVQPNGSSSQLLGSTISPNEIPSFLDVYAPPYKEHNRGFDWMMEGKLVTIDTSEQQWQNLMQPSSGLTAEGSIYNTNTSVYQQDYGVEPLNLIYYPDFISSEEVQGNGECNFFLNPDLVSLENQSTTETSRGFIDAWSNDNPNTENNQNESSVSSHGNLSPSSLTLSMAMAVGNVLDEEMGQIEMGLGAPKTEDHKPQVSSWLSSGSWLASTPGGPLAEVLRPSTLAIGSNPDSGNGSGNAVSPPATTVSSPSGVLQRTMLSLSDSSVCNSPTLAASTPPPETVAFQWLG